MRRDERRYLVVLLALAAANVLCYRLRAASLPTAGRTKVLALPASVGSWQGTEAQVDKRTWAYLGAEDMVARRYDVDGLVVEVVGVAGDQWREVHSPANCFPSMGWHVLRSEGRVLARVAGLDSDVPVRYLLVSKDRRRMVALYTFLLGGRPTASWLRQSGRMVWAGMWGRRRPGALLLLTAPAEPTEEQAGEKISALTVQLCAQVAESLGNGEQPQGRR